MCPFPSAARLEVTRVTPEEPQQKDISRAFCLSRHKALK